MEHPDFSPDVHTDASGPTRRGYPGHAQEASGHTLHTLTDRLSAIRTSVEPYLEPVRHPVAAAQQFTEAHVRSPLRDHPWWTVGSAAGLGLAVGLRPRSRASSGPWKAQHAFHGRPGHASDLRTGLDGAGRRSWTMDTSAPRGGAEMHTARAGVQEGLPAPRTPSPSAAPSRLFARATTTAGDVWRRLEARALEAADETGALLLQRLESSARTLADDLVAALRQGLGLKPEAAPGVREGIGQGEGYLATSDAV